MTHRSHLISRLLAVALFSTVLGSGNVAQAAGINIDWGAGLATPISTLPSSYGAAAAQPGV